MIMTTPNKSIREKAIRILGIVRNPETISSSQIDIAVDALESFARGERESGFHEGKEFAILTIGNAITSEEGCKSPFLGYSIATKCLRKMTDPSLISKEDGMKK